MTGPTIFADLEVDGARWADRLLEPTPVEAVNGRWYKREDAFAPLGYGGINGSKLRQLIHLLDVAPPAAGVVTGASVLSPQVSMAALTARHYRLPAVVVLGGTRPDTAMRHPNVEIAAAAGAEFRFVPVGYNPALQGAVRKLHDGDLAAHYWLRYGITNPDGDNAAEIAAFHAVGAAQVANLPDTVDTIVMTAGSCNSCASVLYGLTRNPPPALRRVVLIGVGPTRLEWLDRRLALIAEHDAEPIGARWHRRYHQHPALEAEHNADTTGADWTLEHHDLHSTGVVRYADRRPYRLDGIDFHPTYEGKAVTWMAQHPELFPSWTAGDARTLFWVVGSEPHIGPMRHALARLEPLTERSTWNTRPQEDT